MAGGQIAKVLNPRRLQDSTGNKEQREVWGASVKLHWWTPKGCRSAGHFEGLLISNTQTRGPTHHSATG